MLWRMVKIVARQQWNAVIQRHIQYRAHRRDTELRFVAKGYAVPETREFLIEGPGGEYRIFVAVPPAPPPPEGYPVLFLVDGNACFGTVIDAIRLQSPWPDLSGVEPMVVVGVGYPGDAAFNHRRRSFDLAPPLRNPTWRSNFVLGPPWNRPGGADAFLSFLLGSLAAALTGKYPVNPRALNLCGLSLGGFFALYALVRKPDAFRAVVAVSSALWWDENRIADDLRTLEAGNEPESRILVAVGSTEIPGDRNICEMMCRFSREAVEALAERGYKAEYLELEGENHQSCITAAMPAVLRFVSSATKC